MKRVAVLMGGISAEREVSLVSGRAVVEGLRAAGFEAVGVDVTRDLTALIAALREFAPDVVFNALHGRYGEDGAIQGVLEWLGLPYTHSGITASALAMDKAMARLVFAQAGLPLAEAVLVSPAELAAADPLPPPYVVKPVAEGSSVGVTVIGVGEAERRRALAAGWRFGERILVEAFIPGRELTVGVLGDRPLTVTEIIPAEGFYDYRAKYQPGASRHVLPAQIPAPVFEAALEMALTAHRVLGCSGASRADFRYDDTEGAPGRLVLLEVNTQPGMTPTSLLPEQAAALGMSFPELCRWIVEQVPCRG
jgi:D-alanine-D-alanine ligase